MIDRHSPRLALVSLGPSSSFQILQGLSVRTCDARHSPITCQHQHPSRLRRELATPARRKRLMSEPEKERAHFYHTNKSLSSVPEDIYCSSGRQLSIPFYPCREGGHTPDVSAGLTVPSWVSSVERYSCSDENESDVSE